MVTCLFVLGLTAILLSGGLGAEDQPNDHREVPILLYVICFFFCGVLTRRSSDQTQEHLMN